MRPDLVREARLHEELRQATRSVHLALERGPLVSSLLRGELPRGTYVALLRNLHAIYAALEAAVDRSLDDVAVRTVFVEELRREARLASDLDALHGSGWRDALPIRPAAQRYVERMVALGDVGPAALLVAHVYVRYLGDLSGGQILKRSVVASFGADSATAFYDFGSPPVTQRLASELRAGLEALDPAPEIKTQIVDEAVWAFARHLELFEELTSS